jgi:multicomponent K+:H+ antiporter subunit A
MRLALIVLLPVLGSVLPSLLIRTSRNAAAMSAGIVTLLAWALLLTHGEAVLDGEVIEAGLDWVPQLGLRGSLYLDGLGFLMANLVLGIGLLVILYARHYLSVTDPMGRFFSYLLLFQGAMVGVVLSGNLLLMLVFWELTSISSFLLIGFWHHLPEGRQGARMALLVTGGGGLALTGGLLWLGQIAGTYELSELLADPQRVVASPHLPWVTLLVLLGCFTKSAQFPFQFWLPHAMAAPTPVSAYLHSATMVKAGVFLLARLWPLLSGSPLWFYLVTGIGLVTMLLGGWIALTRNDLKSLMAYSTVSHLGLMVMLLGLATPSAVVAALLHLLSHAVFKAALFMGVGIIDHEAGTRDLRRLGGLAGWLPITATLCGLAAAASAGLPPLSGFVSKELMLEEVLHHPWWGPAWLLPGLVLMGASLAMAYALRFFVGTFFGRAKSVWGAKTHDPGWGLWLPPAVLVVLSLLLGLLPGTLAEPLVEPAVAGVIAPTLGSVAALPEMHLKLWHGWGPALQMSLLAMVLGVLLWGLSVGLRSWPSGVWWLDGKRMFEGLAEGFGQGCGLGIARLYNGSLARYVGSLLAGAIVLALWGFMTGVYEPGMESPLTAPPSAVVAWCVLVGGCVVTMILHRRRLVALLTLSAVGLVASLAFIYLSAPDLALTQISVEVVTVILLLLAMFFFPKVTLREETWWTKGRDALLAGIAGLGAAGLSWAVMSRPLESISDYYIQRSKPAGGGSNVVNVILVDFRGFDTLCEITVLGIASLMIFSLLEGARRGSSARTLDTWSADQPRCPDKHPALMLSATRVLLPLALMVGAYIFLRGHNEPGGGFVAGLVVTIALVIQYMISGFSWADERISIDYHAWIGLGIMIAGGTGIAAVVMDYPFLTSAHTHLHLPWLGDLELSSAMAFDTGVMMTVVGAVMLMLANLARLGRRAERAVERSADQVLVRAWPADGQEER